MTPREHLHELVDQLDGEAVDAALSVLQAYAEVPGQRRPLPEWVGMLEAEADLAEHSEEIIRDEHSR
jgi:hypothetical protein